MGIKTVGLNNERSSKLEKKAIELIIQTGKKVKESEIVVFLIDEMLNKVDAEIVNDEVVLFINEDKEEKK